MQLEVLFRLNYRETLLEFYRCNDMEIEKILAYKIFELLEASVVSEGGDGDAIWLTRYFKLDDILLHLQDYNISQDSFWEIKVSEKYISWGDDQEWVYITNSQQLFDTFQCTMSIIY